MAQLRQGYEDFVARAAEVVVIGPEDKQAFADYWAKEHLPFRGVPDPDHSVSRSFGQQVKLLKLGRMPAQVVVGRDGMARWAHYGHDMADIPSNAKLLRLLDQLAALPLAPPPRRADRGARTGKRPPRVRKKA
jgi:peroxiredoxin